MNVAVISWLHGKPVPPKGYGGIERFCEILTMGLASGIGHNVTLLAPPGSQAPCGNVEVIECNDMVEAVNIIATLHVDVVHDNNCWHPQAPVRQTLKAPFLSTTHVNDAVGWSQNVVYLSRAQRQKHATQLNRNLDNSFVIPVPFDPRLEPRKDGYDPNSPYCLYIGSITEYKGVIEAASVAAGLNKSLVVCGDAAGPYADALHNLKNVIMVGAVDGLEKWSYLCRAYAVMCCHNAYNGWSEPGCGVVGEANACNVPVIALNNGCLPELVHTGQNGWIANSWQEVLEMVKDRPKIFSSLDYAQHHWGLTKIAGDYTWLYQRLMDGKTWN